MEHVQTPEESLVHVTINGRKYQTVIPVNQNNIVIYTPNQLKDINVNMKLRLIHVVKHAANLYISIDFAFSVQLKVFLKKYINGILTNIYLSKNMKSINMFCFSNQALLVLFIEHRRRLQKPFELNAQNTYRYSYFVQCINTETKRERARIHKRCFLYLFLNNER